MPHWLGDAATRGGLKGASALLIPPSTSTEDAWEMSARALSTTPTALASRIAPIVGLRAANLEVADPKSLRLVPERLARKYTVYPLRDDDRQLVVATSDPNNLEGEQALAFAAARRVVFEVAPPHLVIQAINRGYADDRTVKREAGSAAQEAPPVERDVGSTKADAAILVVDDDPVQRLWITTMLEKTGFRVAQAEDGAAALKRIRAGEECQLLLTDLEMPVMDGDTLIRKLRSDPRTAALPIIVVTGSEHVDRESQLIEIGADDYIRKPVDPPRLVARVRGALRRAS